MFFLEPTYGRWNQPMEGGTNLWKVEPTYGRWNQPMEGGTNLWKGDCLKLPKGLKV